MADTEYKDSTRVYWQVSTRQIGEVYIDEAYPLAGGWSDHEVTIATTENPATSIKLHITCQEDRTPSAAQVAHALNELSARLIVMLMDRNAYPISGAPETVGD